MLHALFRRSAASRTFSAMAAHSAAPSWAQLIRAQSIPAATRPSTNAGSDAARAGNVTMIRTPRSLGPNSSSVRVPMIDCA